MSKFKAEDFMRDLGIELEVELVEARKNVIQLPVPNLGAEVAVMRIIDNLQGTYGHKVIYDILQKLTHE